jgi:hypothetical protein
LKKHNPTHQQKEGKEMDSFVTTSPGGHYHDACLSKGFVLSHQHIVVRFSAWSKWYNQQRFTRTTVPVPVPAFVGDTYAIAQDMANELNKQLTTEGATI